MKITSTLQRTSSDFEQRKRLIARKEMDNAYKKNAKFAEASKNPLLAALENLLSGKAEKDLHNQDIEAIKQLNFDPFMQVEITQPEVKGINQAQAYQVVDEDVIGGEESIQAPLTNAPKESTQVFENVQTEVEEKPPYAGESFDVEVPVRFSSDVKRDVEAPTVFGKELEKELFTRTFNKAKSTYSTHIAMVKNSYRSYNEPQFSMVV